MVTLDKEYMERMGFHWEEPEDAISYIRNGIRFLEDTEGDESLEEKRNKWKGCIIEAAGCLDWE